MIAKQIFLAVTFALVAVPASAADNAAAPKADKSPSLDQKKYCLNYDAMVGSRVRTQECKTKAEWAKERVDIDKMMKE